MVVGDVIDVFDLSFNIVLATKLSLFIQFDIFIKT